MTQSNYSKSINLNKEAVPIIAGLFLPTVKVQKCKRWLFKSPTVLVNSHRGHDGSIQILKSNDQFQNARLMATETIGSRPP